MAVTKGGVTFTFSDAGGGLAYYAPSGGRLTYVQDPGIAGPPEPFPVAFSVPVNFIQFGMMGGPPMSVGTQLASVKFYNGATLLATLALNASLEDRYPEGLAHLYTHNAGDQHHRHTSYNVSCDRVR